MNQYLYNYLGGQGATALDFNDRIMQYLIAEITTLGGNTGGTMDDLWKEYGRLLGVTGRNTEELMMEWAAFKGSTGSTWGDLMRNLP